ncbi:hypothetical protein F511_09106 [Dorcoceras hygrometricum]|uniref:Uncharacterized protein n=1 Tax=Dorcoceras hygrometricum TaxID=472368 RepID=A0A2Z7AK57_9LAMI|nr:hypothetical protein F511_09106 [Dorcoceras hygrometricum]
MASSFTTNALQINFDSVLEITDNGEMVGSFDEVTHERFLMMTAIHFGIQGDPIVTMGEETIFPHLKILSAKAVKTYIATNKTIDARGKTDEPGVAKISRSKKRPIATGDEPAVTKKKRTSKRKASSSKDKMEIVSVAQEAIPLQTFDPSTAVFVEKRAAVEEAVGEQSDEPTADTIEKETVSTADEVDNVIAQVLAEIAQMKEIETAKTEQPMKQMSENKQFLRSSDVTAEATETDVVMEQADFVEPEIAEGTEMGTILTDSEVTKSDNILVEVDESSAATTAKEIVLATVTVEYNTEAICFWKFGPQCPTSPLLPPRKAPLEDFDGYRTSANTHPHKRHLYGLLDSTMHTSRNCVTNYIHKFNLSPVDMLTSSLLLTAFSSRYADVIIADTSSCATDSRLLLFIFFFDISSSRLHRFCSISHFRMRPVIFPPKRSNEQDSLLCNMLTSALLIPASSNRYADVMLSPVDMLTSSLLLTAFSSRYADVIVADTSSCATDSRLLLFVFFFDISSSRLHRFCSRSHFRMRPVLLPLKWSNEQDSLLCTVLTSLNKDIAAKEEDVLTWAETDSVQVALQRKVHILSKYREMLLRKLLESHRANFSFGQPWSVMALQIIDLLSVAHSTSVKHLLMQRQAHGLQWTNPCFSMLFEGALDRGFYIPRYHKIIVLNCWLRLLRRIGDVWVVEDGYDRWVHEDETPVSQLMVQLPQRTSLESLAPIFLFFQPVQCLSASSPLPVKTWGWYRTRIGLNDDFRAIRLPGYQMSYLVKDFDSIRVLEQLSYRVSLFSLSG